jgi:hypothetical protein
MQSNDQVTVNDIELSKASTKEMTSLPFKYRKYAIFTHFILESLVLSDSITPETSASISDAMHLMKNNITEQYNMYKTFDDNINEHNKKYMKDKRDSNCNGKKTADKNDSSKVLTATPDEKEKKPYEGKKRGPKPKKIPDEVVTPPAAEQVVHELNVKKEDIDDSIPISNKLEIKSELVEEEYLDEGSMLNSEIDGDDDESVDLNMPISNVEPPNTHKHIKKEKSEKQVTDEEYVTAKEAARKEKEAAKEAVRKEKEAVKKEKEAVKEAVRKEKEAAKEAVKEAARKEKEAAKEAAKEAVRKEKEAAKEADKEETSPSNNGVEETTKKKMKKIIKKAAAEEEETEEDYKNNQENNN